MYHIVTILYTILVPFFSACVCLFAFQSARIRKLIIFSSGIYADKSTEIEEMF